MIKKPPALPLPWINQETQSLIGAIAALKSVHDNGMRNGAPEKDYLFQIESTLDLLNQRNSKLKELKEIQLNPPQNNL